MVMSLSASSVHAAATIALVDAMAGMMFFTTPPVSCHVTPCARLPMLFSDAQRCGSVLAYNRPATLLRTRRAPSCGLWRWCLS